MNNMDGYWFKSSKFEIEAGEDEDINPGIYGRQLAIWLKSRLEESGYSVELIEEDWGRCLMCSWDPFRLWVGCANVWNPDLGPGQSPNKNDIVWHCFATAEVPFWKRLFGRVDTTSAVGELNANLARILAAESQIELVDEP